MLSVNPSKASNILPKKRKHEDYESDDSDIMVASFDEIEQEDILSEQMGMQEDLMEEKKESERKRIKAKKKVKH